MAQTITVLRTETISYYADVALDELAKLTGLSEDRILALADSGDEVDPYEVDSPNYDGLLDLTEPNSEVELSTFRFVKEN